MSRSLDGTLPLQPRGPAGAFVLSDKESAEISNGRKAYPVLVTVNGHTLPLRVARMGRENLIGIRRELREQAGLVIGEEYAVRIAADDTEREVELPSALAEVLRTDPDLAAAFEELSYSKRKEAARLIAEAKREETRSARLTKLLDSLRG